MSGDPVVLVNRTQHNLNFTADGRQYVLKPGKNYGFNEAHVKFAVGQNPLFGTEDYYSLEFQSLVGVEGRTDCSEIPEQVLNDAQDAERFDLATMAPEATKNRRAVAAKYRPRPGTRVSDGGTLNALAQGS